MNYPKPITFFLIQLGLLIAFGAGAQTTASSCLTFKALQKDSLISGDLEGILLTESEVAVSFKPFLYEDGTSDKGKLWIWPDLPFNAITDNEKPEGPFLMPSNLNFHFNFKETNGKVERLCFDFYEGGGSINIAANGDSILILNSLAELDGKEITPGVFAEVKLRNTTNTWLPFGTICLKGKLNDLTIGGQELIIAGFCFSSLETCRPKISKITTSACTAAGTFYLYFEGEGKPASDSVGFTVIVNNEIFGPYFDFPIQRVGPVSSYNSTEYYIQFFDNYNPNCKFDTLFQGPDCSVANCAIDNLEAWFYPECEADGSSFLTLDFDYRLVDSTRPNSFLVSINGASASEFKLEDLPVRIDYSSIAANAPPEVKVCLTNAGDCCARTLAKVRECKDTCQIESVKVDVLGCTPKNGYDLDVYLNFTSNAQPNFPFYLFIENKSFGPYSAKELPIRLFDVQVLTEATHFEVKACTKDSTSTSVGCCAAAWVEKPYCPPYFQTCIEFERLDREAYGGNLGDRPGSVVFSESGVQVRLIPLQTLDWTEYFESLLVFSTSNRPEYQSFQGAYLHHEGISTAYNFNGYPEPVKKATFDYYNEGGLINLSANGAEPILLPDLTRGVYQLGSSVRVTVEPATGSGRRGRLHFTGNIQSLLVGGLGLNVDNLCLNQEEECRLYGLDILDWACEDGTYAVFVDLKTDLPNKDLLVKTKNGYKGIWNSEDFPTWVDGLPGSPGEKDALIISDPQNPDCEVGIEYEINCRPDDCVFGPELRIKQPPCADDGTFHLVIDFDHKGTGRAFSLGIDNDSLGLFSYDDLPLEIGPFEYPDDGGLLVTVEDIDDPNCGLRKRFEPTNCNACEVRDLLVEVLECQPNGEVRLFVDFNHENSANEYFDLYLDGEAVGYYKLADLPLEISQFLPKRPSGAVVEAKVCVNDQPNCCARTTFTVPSCPPFCGFRGLQTEVVDCAEESFFLQFKFEPGKNEGRYLAFIDGQVFGPFSYADPVQVIGPFRADGHTQYDLFLIDVNDPTCFEFTEFGPVECRIPDCGMANLRMEAQRCNSDGSYVIAVNFDYYKDDLAYFAITAPNGNVIDTFRADELPYRFNAFITDAAFPQKFQVCLLRESDCCLSTFVEPISCVGNCADGILLAETSACKEEGFFVAELFFENYQPDPNELFFLYLNGDFLDTVTFEKGYLRIDSLSAATNTSYIFYLKSVARPDTQICEWKVEVIPPACFNEEEVWPGDANNDGIANHYDLLHIGVAFGKEGLSRNQTDAATNAWEGIPATNWNNAFVSGLNFKFADCNGDGRINREDIDVLKQNYGLDRGTINEQAPLPGTEFDPPIGFELPEDGELPEEEQFSIPIILGAAENTVEDIYGLAFSIYYDPAVLHADSVYIEFPATWLGEPGVNLEPLAEHFPEEGRFEIALTRTDQNEVSGYGPVAHLIGIKDDIAGFTDSRLEVDRAVQMDHQANLQGLQGMSTTVTFAQKETIDQPEKISLIDLEQNVTVYPNPTDGLLNISTPYGLTPDIVRIFSSDGRTLSAEVWNTNQVSLAPLPEGLYIVKIQFGRHVLHKRIFKR